MSSSRSNTARSTNASRTPGGLRTLPPSTSLSNVHIEAIPSTSKLEDRASSRRTLTRHLSSSNISTDARAGPSNTSNSRNRSASTYTSASSSIRGSGVQQARTSFRRSETTQSLYIDAGNATPSQKLLSRSTSNASIATSSRRTPSRSVSASSILHGSTRTPSKSTLSVPQLSTIEGSIADLAAEDWPQIAPPLPIDAMKRVAEARNGAVEAQAKRHASAQLVNGGQTVVTDTATITDRKGKARAVTMGTEPGVDAESSWTSYFGSTRKRRPSRVHPPTEASTPRAADAMPPHLEDVFRAPSPSASLSVDENSDAQSSPACGTKPSALVPAKRKSYSNLRRSPSPIDSQLTVTSMSLQNKTPSTSDGRSAADVEGAGSADMEASAAVSQQLAAGAAPANQVPSAAGWWFWSSSMPVPAAATIQPPTEQQLAAEAVPSDAKSVPADSAQAVTPEAANYSPTGTVRLEVNPDETPSTPKRQSMEAPNTWSSWLASYVNGKPVQTTSVTYGLGISDSPQPSNASTKASSMVSANLPEADETFPEVLPADLPTSPAKHSPPTLLHTRSVLLDTVPPSTWSTFFTSRFANPHQRVTQQEHSRDEPCDMDVDFSQMTVAAETPHSAATVSNAIGDTVKKPTATSAAPVPIANTQLIAKSSSLAHSPASVASSKLLRSSKVNGTPMVSQPSKDSIASSSKLQSSQSATGQANTSLTQSPSIAAPSKPSKPNLLLPSFDDTFHTAPRIYMPPVPQQPERPAQPSLKRAVTAPLRYIFSGGSPKRANAPALPALPEESQRHDKRRLSVKSQCLPKALTMLGEPPSPRKSGKVCVIGVHGWFIQSYLRNVVGEPTGTSTKFASMMRDAVKDYYMERGVPIPDEAITTIPLEGNGTVKDRLALLYNNLMRRQDWIEALNTADSIFVVAHSQGCIVSTLLIDRLINEGEINGTRCAFLCMCSISQGPFVSLNNTWTGAYLYFETAAAKELFEFQNPDSKLAQEYIGSMQHVLDAGVKVLLVASLNDQVVPLYSGLFSSISHPLLLRTIFIDPQAFETSADFMTNLVVFSTKLRNAGISPHGLDFHLSEALAGSLMGVGHSTVYKESIVYKYAVRYLFETSGVMQPYDTKSSDPAPPHFDVEAFDPRIPTNPYFLPWALRGIIDDEQIRANFESELSKLREDFEEWNPKTKALQGVKMALEPLRGIPRRKADSSRAPSLHETEETGKDPKKSQAKL